MRIFLAGATGVLGRRLLPRLVGNGHVVFGLTRSESKAPEIEQGGGEPVVCDVFDRLGLIEVVCEAEPDLVIHQVTDLPDSLAELPQKFASNARVRQEGTKNLIAAAEAAGHPGLLAQSVAWELSDELGARAVSEHEHAVLGYGGVLLRYGQLYGPGTYYEHEVPAPPHVHVERAVDATLAAVPLASLSAPRGAITITD